MKPLTRHMTLAETADMLGMTGQDRVRRLRRILLRLEKRHGRTYMVRSGGDGVGVRYLVTLSLLRKSAPELFGEMIAMRSEVERHDEQIADLRKRQNAIASRVREISGELREIRASEAAKSSQEQPRRAASL